MRFPSNILLNAFVYLVLNGFLNKDGPFYHRVYNGIESAQIHSNKAAQRNWNWFWLLLCLFWNALAGHQAPRNTAFIPRYDEVPMITKHCLHKDRFALLILPSGPSRRKQWNYALLFIWIRMPHSETLSFIIQ